MPYKNARNKAVADQLIAISQNHINREKEIADFATSYEIPSQLESVVMRDPLVHGGSGFAASTVQDLGFEPTLGATSGEGKPARKPRKKSIAVGEGLSAAGISGGGVSAGGISGGALLSLRDLDSMEGQMQDTIQAKETLKAEGMTAGGKGRSKRNEIVREVMKKHNLSLPAASKYVKEHNLY